MDKLIKSIKELSKTPRGKGILFFAFYLVFFAFVFLFINLTDSTLTYGDDYERSTSSNINLRNAAIENGAKVIASLMKTYNIPMSKVLPHQARSGKHCPHDILDRYGHEKFRK